jgi:TRAP-type C4-dicarboxylate transport system permease small subunit
VLQRSLALLERTCAVISAGLTAVVVLVLSAQIFFRYVLNDSLIWSEEVATWGMVWIVYSGSAVLMGHWQHVHIPIFIRLLPLTLRPPAIIFAKLATTLTVALIAYYGLVAFNGTFHIVSQTTGISTAYIKLAVPLGMAAMTIFAAAGALEDMRRWGARDWSWFERYGTIEIGEGVTIPGASLDPPPSAG